MLTPLASSRWDFDAAAHLLVRAGIGGTPAEIQKTLAFGPGKAVNTLVTAEPDNFQPPSWAATDDEQDLREQLKDAVTPDEQQTIRKILQQKFQSEMKDLTRWWVSRMLNTSSPLVEKMTLFWHGHFATSAEKVRPAYKMWLQNETFRREGLGNFRSLIKAVSRDPAMMVWLDTVQSKKESPNENFAREVMELFTLGEGHYTEADVKAAARAFTGYRIDQLDQSFRFALIFRYKLAHQLVDGVDPREIGFPRPPAMEMTAARPVLTPPISVSDLVVQEDRSQPDRLVRKIAIRTFQSTHQEELIAKFRNFVATRPAPFDDNTIRELLILMMTTPEYQIT